MFWANEEWVKVFRKPAKNEAPASQQAAAQFGRGDLAAGDLAQGEEHAGGLDEDDHYHQAHRQDRRQVEGRRAEVQRGDDVEPGALGQTTEVDHAHAAGDRVAQAHAHQHRDVDPETAHEAVDQEDGAEHQAGEEQEVQGAEVFRAPPPPAQLIATGNRHMPIEVITVPVTSGGKKRTMRDMKGR